MPAMRATGLFFLRTAAYTRCDATGLQREGVYLPVIERGTDKEGRPVVVNTLLAKWRGAEALAFFDENTAELRAGRPLHLELDRLQVREGEVVGNVTHLELAPLAPSWQRAQATQQTTAAEAAQERSAH